MYNILLILVLLSVLVWFIIKLCRSSKFNKFCKDIDDGLPADSASTKETINDIKNTKKSLVKKVNQNKKVAEEANKDSEKIKSYLGQIKK
ncbi:MAG: hypothetical protein J7L15_08885 [Clostridiales bacterium]|nr:hypothetical protein [Clostridiales bacterium]